MDGNGGLDDILVVAYTLLIMVFIIEVEMVIDLWYFVVSEA